MPAYRPARIPTDGTPPATAIEQAMAATAKLFENGETRGRRGKERMGPLHDAALTGRP